MSKRNLNIELIRIISMLMIVYHHFSIHTNWTMPEIMGVRKYYLQSLGHFGKIGVIIFILITGFFFIKKSSFLMKFLTLNNLVTFYTLSIFTISLSWSSFNQDIFVQSALPLVFNQYWFITGYIILLLFQPLVVRYLIETNREEKAKLFFLMILFFYLPTLFGFIFQIKKHFVPGVYLSFILIAFLGDLIREYQEELKTIYFKYIVFSFIFSLSLIQSRPFIVDFLASKEVVYPSFLFTGTQSLNAILFSFSLFVILLKIHIPSKLEALIIFISSVTFEVYLIHDNPIIRPILWNKIFHNSDFYWSNYLFIIALIEPLLVFMICVFIARARVFLKNKVFS